MYFLTLLVNTSKANFALSFPSSIAFSISLKSLLIPETPNTPDFLFSRSLTSSKVKSSFSIINGIIAGSIFPDLVPMAKPSNGVKPILVSIDFPFCTAHILAPFPKWQVTIFKSSTSLPSISAAFKDTYLWEVPWKPYLLTPYFSYNSYGRG